MKHALEIILPGKCHHMISAMESHGNEWRDILNGTMTDAQFKEFFVSKYVAAVDGPFCWEYERAMKVFPDAKVVLTLREPDTWVKSVKATVLHAMDNKFPLTLFPVLSLFSSDVRNKHTLIKAMRGSHHDIEFKGAVIEGRGEEYFNNWTKSVEQNVPADKLLKFSVKEGWKPLCEFLNVPIPDVPFPRVN